MKKVALVLDFAAPFGTQTLRGIKKYLLAQGRWELPEHFSVPAVTLDQLRGWKGDGVICRVIYRDMVPRLRRMGIPVVNVSNLIRDVPFPRVVPDDPAVGRMAADHLLDRGYHRLAFCGLTGHYYSDLRCESFRRRIREHGLDCLTPPFPPQPMSDKADLQLLRKWLGGITPPFGLFACNDIRGRHVINTARSIGMRVPEDIAVVAVDNDPLQGDLSDVPLSSIALAWEQVGFRAASLLEELMEGGPVPAEPVRIPPAGLITRLSSDALSIEDPDVVRVLRFIREHACENIGVENLLDLVPISRRLLENKFRRFLGRTPYAHILHTRLEAGKQLLVQTDLNVENVARRCGFGDARQFSLTFRKNVGMPPTTFRAQYRLREFVQ